ncbi:MAG TPA: NAD(P)-dependent oxidoreductase [Candidatus Koribacter sp.]
MSRKIVITGAAGLVGQNLIPRLEQRNFGEIVAIDKHPTNTETLRRLHPNVRVIHADLAEPGPWQDEFAGCTHLMNGHAQIGGIYTADYTRNNVTATERVIEAAVRNNVSYAVNISSSAVTSAAVDDYTESKKGQEKIVRESGIKQIVLRPALMFGLFDRKHVGWLARYMQRSAIFPVPGNGRYIRQPLYVGDFCNIIVSSLEKEITGTYPITGVERIDYIDLMRTVNKVLGSPSHVVRVPYSAFWALLKLYAVFNKNPAFTTRQLEALVTPDVFDLIDWPTIFGVTPTPLQEALNITFCDPTYSKVVLDF